MKIISKLVTIGFVLLGISVLTGCTNTLHGAGKDIQNIGTAMNPPPKKVVHQHKAQQSTTTTTTSTNDTTTSTQTDESNSVQTNMSGMPINTGSSTKTTGQ